jgi:hypothetical protein
LKQVRPAKTSTVSKEKKMAEEAINMHKKNAMGISPKATGKGSMPKFAKGGKVTRDAEIMNNQAPSAQANKMGAYSEKKVRTLINDSSQKRPLPVVGGKIATMKKGGSARGR